MRCCHAAGELRATGNSDLRAATKSRRVAIGASAGRWRQTRTMEEARALVPCPIMRLLFSVRIGHVPVTEKPASITASRKVSQPVLEVPSSPFFSDCLKA